MKFYKRFPGDINIKTGHLDPAEFGCYDRLLDHYYATEKPIPASGAYSICRAVKPEHRRACDKVLAEFFVLTPEGWAQQRADEVIAEALPAIEAARENGKRGGRPPKNPKRTPKKPTGFSTETQDGEKQKASQKPEETSEPTVPHVSAAKPPRATKRPPADFEVTAEMAEWAAENAPGVGVLAETAKFRDHTFAAARSDWPATWRNWIRNAAERLANQRQHNSGEATRDRAVRERVAQFAPGAAAKAPGFQQPTAEVIDVTARRLG